MTEARLSHLLCHRDFNVYRMAYREWGDPDNPNVILCVHGLTRNSRDFARLASALADRYRVVAPDVLGRGLSDYLHQANGYTLPGYIQDMMALIARLGVDRVGWVGTSMGGLIGMAMAALQGSPINRLVINDVGPELPRPALERIAAYVGSAPPFPSRQAAEAYLRVISASFGPHSDDEWAYLNDLMLKPDDNGGWQLNYDRTIAEPFRAMLTQPAVDLWPFYDQIKCPVLLLRGAESDLLSEDTASAMEQRGPMAQRVDFAGVGHAPTFQHDDQIAVVKTFFHQP